MKSIIAISWLLLILPIFLTAQNKFDWYEPKNISGIAQPDTAHKYNRMPSRMETLVRKPVWDLSKNTAGEFVHFRTTARDINIYYQLNSPHKAFPHMPETGVSGVDLYAVDRNGQWNWAAPHYSFGDTAIFRYKSLFLEAGKMADYYLYLPLYNSVEWLSISVPANEKFEFAQENEDKPIVAYGTSILQGGVSSRPGLAWTNILQRELDRTVINLGFSGNGRFEAPIFELMSNIDASLFILDCMPNLDGGFLPDSSIKNRVYDGVKTLQNSHPDIPILLVEHAAGFSPFYMDTARLNTYRRSSELIARIYKSLQEDGYKNIYLLTQNEIGFDMNCTTDGIHPNDIGMMRYAGAFEKKIREILNEPSGSISTEIPVQQYRDGYNWLKRHEEVKSRILSAQPNLLILGNSIINFWGGLPVSEMGIARGKDSWTNYLDPMRAQNAGFGWDRIENVLWRIYHGELDNFTGKQILVMIGTNNLGINSNEEIVDGLAFLLNQIHNRKKEANIVMAGILPRRGMEKRVAAINLQIKKMALAHHCRYIDFGQAFLQKGKINPSLFVADGLHPNTPGYELLGKEIANKMK
jgi:lysophospholipase L1-like esterase